MRKHPQKSLLSLRVFRLAESPCLRTCVSLKHRLVLCGLLTGCLLCLGFSSGCSKKAAPFGGDKKAIECSDFANNVAGAYQEQLVASKGGAVEKPEVRKAVMELKKKLFERCRAGKVVSKAISCVMKTTPRTYRNVRKCLAGEDIPAMPGSGDEDE